MDFSTTEEQVPYTCILYPSKDFDVEGIRHRSQKEHREYIQLPILARFDWQVSKDVRLHLAVGPYLAVGLGGKDVYKRQVYSILIHGLLH